MKQMPEEAADQMLALQEALTERAVAQGKIDIASDMLHDIGNAVVGFGSYLVRIKGALEEDASENLAHLRHFFDEQRAAMAQVIGEAKADALVSMLAAMVASQRHNRDELQRSVDKQLSIIGHIQEILAVQRQYIAGDPATESKAVNLRGIIGDCLSMLSASIEKRAIAVRLDVAVEWPVILGDRTRLMQVVLNILKNSMEALQGNPADKRIVILLHASAGLLVLKVEDNGEGFDEVTAGRLFERGFTTKSSGTGLGLHHCRHIVESHAGRIFLTSEGPGKGSITTINFNIQYPPS
jgi:signal transduction histidine kinase